MQQGLIMLKLVPIGAKGSIWFLCTRIAESESSEFVLRCNFPSFAGQITGANPTIPGMFPNMFPLATNQVFFVSLFPAMVI